MTKAAPKAEEPKAAKEQGPCANCGRTVSLPEWVDVKRGDEKLVACSEHCAKAFAIRFPAPEPKAKK